ncbi:ribonuclease Y [Nicoliella spurrieriana]|uniref:Ribonuclease Y n=1 Tax=Nicoliella spurrieriana TaxID=2925830 RepID=A0A976RSN2_9LACO|nr:ribonuclease Y [Nicoliella spurrieriana]UQS87155.1 ribonuclease Y [Nicoliella spurrieriana]
MYPLVALVMMIAGVGCGVITSNKQTAKKLANAKRRARQYLDERLAEIKSKKQQVISQNQARTADYERTITEDLATQITDNQTRETRIRQHADYLKQLSSRIDDDERRYNEIKDLNAKNRAFVKQTIIQADQLVVHRHQILNEQSQLDDNTVKQMVLDETAQQLRRERDIEVKYLGESTETYANRIADNVIIEAIQRGPEDVPRSHIERNVNIPSAEIRNRLLSHDEQHLRLIETLTGTGLIFDPDDFLTLHIVTHDPIRREVVRRALNALIVSRQINNANIETQVNNARQDVNDELRETGEDVVLSLHLGAMHPDLMKIIGRLKFRTSYGQNVLYHSIEVAQLAGVIASELGLNPRLARRAGMLHDIGKAIDHEVEGTHVELGVKIAETYHEEPIVVNAIAAHHGDVEPISLIATLISTSDAISGARPGARSESVEEYVSRLKNLEKIADTQPGVKESYAIQAGREIRIIVDPKRLNDHDMSDMTKHVQAQIENDLTYPGKIKVTAIRKLNVIQYVGYNQKRRRYANATK